ncbi:MAG TPA: ATP-binding protein [Gemmatimonadales bacterium]|nr:ATP-binding protein [Gemmatimonadales bacterium]
MTAPLPASLRLCLRRRRVPGPSGATVQVSLRVPSDVGCIEEVVDLLMRHCCTDPWFSRRLRFNIRVAVAEALANAIVAGNREDRSKSVQVQADVCGDHIRIQVTDQGHGFDPATITEPVEPAELDRPCGRGLFLIRHLVDDVSFNDQGNSICMTLRRR